MVACDSVGRPNRQTAANPQNPQRKMINIAGSATLMPAFGLCRERQAQRQIPDERVLRRVRLSLALRFSKASNRDPDAFVVDMFGMDGRNWLGSWTKRVVIHQQNRLSFVSDAN